MVLPWIVMITLLLLLFSLFVTQRALLYYSSSISAERAAFGWSNSSKDTRTGAYPTGQYDGLYWRLLDDRLVKGIFGISSENEVSEVKIELHSRPVEASSNVSTKLWKQAVPLMSTQESLGGVISYRNIGVKRQIGVSLTTSWSPKALVWMRGEAANAVQAKSLVVEPTEFIRTFDLASYYASKMKSASEGSLAYRKKAGAVLLKRGS